MKSAVYFQKKNILKKKKKKLCQDVVSKALFKFHPIDFNFSLTFQSIRMVDSQLTFPKRQNC